MAGHTRIGIPRFGRPKKGRGKGKGLVRRPSRIGKRRRKTTLKRRIG